MKVEELVNAGRLIAPEPVRLEIEKRSDELYAWIKLREAMFLPLEENIQKRVSHILERFPRLVAQRKSRFAADPFVIALAIESDSILISEEIPQAIEISLTYPTFVKAQVSSEIVLMF